MRQLYQNHEVFYTQTLAGAFVGLKPVKCYRELLPFFGLYKDDRFAIKWNGETINEWMEAKFDEERRGYIVELIPRKIPDGAILTYTSKVIFLSLEDMDMSNLKEAPRNFTSIAIESLAVGEKKPGFFERLMSKFR